MQSLKQGIHELHFEVTGNCQLSCIYCYNADCRDKKNELTFNEIKRLFEECKKYGTKVYTITGGEPFVRPDIFKIMGLLKDEYVAILTNGKFLYDMIDMFGEEFLRTMKGLYPQIKEFKISWDGFASHNNMRVGSDWKKIMNLVKILKKHKYKVVINTIVLSPNQLDLLILYEYLIKLKVDRWRVDMPFLLGFYKNNHKTYLPPDPSIYTKIFARIIKKHEDSKNKMVFEIFNLYKSEFKPSNTVIFDGKVHPCEYKRELLSIKPNGDVVFCPSLNFAMANYRKEGSLEKVFNKEKQHKFYKLKTNNIKDCKNCRYLLICGGGCRCNALYDFGDWTKRDTSACMTFPFWEKEILPILKKSHQVFFRKHINKKGFNPSNKFHNPAIAKQEIRKAY